jgi:hypothetical protein
MLSHDFRTIFVHVPKAAGQSIETVFLRKLNLTWRERGALLLRPNRDPTKGPPRLAHLYADEYVACGHISAEDFAGYFKFGVVRNPWARAVSEYKFAYQPRGVAFEMFLSEVVGKGRGVVEQRHVDPQKRYLYGEDGTLLVDRVLRYESLADGFAEVSRTIFGRVEPLPMINASRDPVGYRAFYNEAGRRLIVDKYRDDIETFGYQFDDG